MNLKKFTGLFLSTTLVFSAGIPAFGNADYDKIHPSVITPEEPMQEVILDTGFMTMDEEADTETYNFTPIDEISLEDLDVNEALLQRPELHNELLPELKSKLNEVSFKGKLDMSDKNADDYEAALNAYNASYEPDKYEPNNSNLQAFPYSKTTKFGVEDHPWQYGYISAGLHDTNDEDWFTIDLAAGTDYFFHLKNLYQDFDMYLFSPDCTNVWGRPVYGDEEEYFYFNAPTSGTYYLAIGGNGIPEYNHYFLWAGPAITTRTMRATTHTSFNILSAGTTSWVNFDATQKAPFRASKSVLNSIRITNTGSGNMPMSWSKQIKSGDKGRIYSATDYSENCSNYQYNTEYVNQVWQVRASVTRTSGSAFTWTPTIYMTYTGIMEPPVYYIP